MDRTDDMAVFVAVVQEGGFTAAARQLSIPLATVSRRILKLEQRLKVQLLTRTTRSISLTFAGRRYYDGAIKILQEVDYLEQEVVTDHTVPRGKLTIASASVFGREILSPIIADFLRTYPSLQVSHVLSNPRFNYLEHGVDVGVHVGTLRDNRMTAIKIGETRVVFCASVDYLKRHHAPTRLADLVQHRCIAYTPLGKPSEWRVMQKGESSQKLFINPAYQANDIDNICQLVEQGAGIGWLHIYQIASALRDGKVKIVMPEHEIPSLPVNILIPQVKHLPEKIRAFVDFSKPLLRQVLSGIQSQSNDFNWLESNE